MVGGGDQAAPLATAFAAPLTIAVASPFGEPVAGGRVTFTSRPPRRSADLAGGLARIGSDGLARVGAKAVGGAGRYLVAAQAAGAATVTLALTNTGEALPAGPRVVAWSLGGVRARATRLVLAFSGPLDAASAARAAAYRFVVAGRDGRLGTRRPTRRGPIGDLRRPGRDRHPAPAEAAGPAPRPAADGRWHHGGGPARPGRARPGRRRGRPRGRGLLGHPAAPQPGPARRDPGMTRPGPRRGP